MKKTLFCALCLVLWLVVGCGAPTEPCKDGVCPVKGASKELSVDPKSWLNSQPLTLAGLKGKVVLLDFWGSWCAPCRKSLPSVQSLYDKYQSAGLVVVGVHTTSGSSGMAECKEKYKLSYPLGVDDQNKTRHDYGVEAVPEMVLIDRAGVTRATRHQVSELEPLIQQYLKEKP